MTVDDLLRVTGAMLELRNLERELPATDSALVLRGGLFVFVMGAFQG